MHQKTLSKSNSGSDVQEAYEAAVRHSILRVSVSGLLGSALSGLSFDHAEPQFKEIL